MNEIKLKIKALAIIFFCCYALVSCFANTVQAENDTATTTNILPNAGTTSSSRDAFDLDGVKTGSNVDLTNNGTHNGFTITCNTQINNACGRALSGELEASRDMKVSASGTLIGIDGTESSTTYTSTQKKLDGGIQLNSYFSVQNCEDGNSSHSCGYSSGADDSYNLHVKIKDANGNTLAEMTTNRTDDSGYNANSAKFHDNLVWNGTGAASYEWYWEGLDGSQSTSALRGPNLLGAELLMDFPTEDYEVFTTEEIEELNEALGTANLSENEIWDVISGMEAVMEEEFALTGNLEEGTRLEISFEETGMTIEIASQETGAIVMETAMVQETFSSVLEEKPIETLKEEIVSMVQEEMPFMQIMEEVAPPAKMETTKPPIEKMKEEVNAKTSTPKEALPMVSKKETLSPTKKEETPKITKAPPSMKTAKEEKPVEKKPTEMVKRETKNEEKKEEAKEEKPTSETTSKSTTETANRQEQKSVQSEKAQVAKLELVMKKVDAKIKNPIKNLAIKNLIKLDIMMGDKEALKLYQNAVFYEPKDIYLEQLQIFDQRQIYANVSLATYVNNDKVAIKANTLHKLNLKKQRLLIELEQLKNGKI
jgi:hypothetical protein